MDLDVFSLSMTESNAGSILGSSRPGDASKTGASRNGTSRNDTRRTGTSSMSTNDSGGASGTESGEGDSRAKGDEGAMSGGIKDSELCFTGNPRIQRIRKSRPVIEM